MREILDRSQICFYKCASLSFAARRDLFSAEHGIWRVDWTGSEEVFEKPKEEVYKREGG